MPQQSLTDDGKNKGEHQSYYNYTKKHVNARNLIVVILIIAAILVFHFRHRIAAAHDRWRTRRRMGYVNLDLSFQDDLEGGLNSESFDIRSNIDSEDSRKGLLEEGKREIKRIMNERGITFDEARLEYTRSRLAENNIDADGMPLDPKTVTFGR